jgi:hypothetical protein
MLVVSYTPWKHYVYFSHTARQAKGYFHLGIFLLDNAWKATLYERLPWRYYCNFINIM